MRRPSTLVGPLCAMALLLGTEAHAVTVFSTDFESGLPAEFSAPGAAIEGVQGYAGLGSPGRQFGGSFLRYADTAVVDTTLTLTGLPTHDTLTLGFLLAVIDSWDGVELLEVLVDGNLLFSNTFELAIGDTSSYAAPPGALLSSGTDLGFSAGSYYQHDRAYDLSLEPAFVGIPHTADTVTITWRLDAAPGGGAEFWQGGADESWAIDDVTVAVDLGTTSTTTTTAPTSSTVPSSTTTTTVVTTSSTVPSSTTTVPTSSTVPSSTTTTLPTGCAGEPDGPTFASLICRLAALLARVNGESGLGAFQPKLAHTIMKARDRAQDARALCATGNAKKAKAPLKQVARALNQYAHRLNGHPARTKLDPALRQTFVDPAGPLRTDVGTLRSTVTCPADA